MWPFEEELVAHFETVKERHDQRNSGNDDDEMEQNDLSPRRRRR